MQRQSGNAEKTKEYTKHLPSGFVTHTEMKARLERNTMQFQSGNAEKTKEYTKHLPSGFVTHTEMKARLERNTMQFQSGNAEKTKDYTKHLPSGFVTFQGMKAKLERRENKVSALDHREMEERMNKKRSYQNTAYSSERKCSTQQIQDTVLYRRDVENDRGDVVNGKDVRYKILLEDPKLAVSFPGRCAPFKVIIMNVNCPSGRSGTEPERRRHILQALILKYKPDLLLLQEFKWANIRGRIWKACQIPDQYYYQGHNEASMIHDECLVTVEDLSTVMRRILESLQRTPLNQLTVVFPLQFNPLPRMCSKLLRSRLEPSLSVICISWHGFHNGLVRRKKIEYFKYLIEFFRNIYIKMNIPILIGGDFNIPMQYIEEYISKPFKLHKYIASKRRNRAGIIDFFISTNELHLTNTTFVDLETLDPDSHATDILDHDPVYTELSNEE